MKMPKYLLIVNDSVKVNSLLQYKMLLIDIIIHLTSLVTYVTQQAQTEQTYEKH